MTIDLEKLRDDLKNESYSAYYMCGYEAALGEAFELETAGVQEVVDTALQRGVDLSRYEVV